MSHHLFSPLVSTLVIGLVLAFALGTLAHKVKLSPIAGYLVAGVLVGPHTPGFIASQSIAMELSQIGIILLMFGVGLHVSWADLRSVRPIALPGAVAEISLVTLMGMAMAKALGWNPVSGLVLGLCLSVASTVVLIRALSDNKITETESGRIAIGWLLVEDMAMVLVLVLLPLLTSLMHGNAGGLLNTPSPLLYALGLTTLKLGAFAAILFYIGRRFLPWMLRHVARTGSRELFRLAVLAIALGMAYGSALAFDISLALGAFFAGMLLAGSTLGQQAAEETLPLRDAFAVLFFISIGMMFNPSVLTTHPQAVLATLGIIVLGKSGAAYLIMRTANASHSVSLTIAASLAQIGEFSFILAALGTSLGLLPEEGRDLIVAGSMGAIILNPVLFNLLAHIPGPRALLGGTPSLERPPLPDLPQNHPLQNHAVVIGYENPSISVVRALISHGIPVYVLEGRDVNLHIMASQMHDAIKEGFLHFGAEDGANFAEAEALILTTPSQDRAEALAARALIKNPDLTLIGYATTPEHEGWLQAQNARLIIAPETDQTSAAAQIADCLIDDGYAQAREA